MNNLDIGIEQGVEAKDTQRLLLIFDFDGVEADRSRLSSMVGCRSSCTDDYDQAEVTKNKKEHQLPLTDFLVLLLAQRLRQRRESQYVFPSRFKRDAHIVAMKDAVDSIVRSSGCTFVPHDTRRTFISLAARLGIGHHIIKKLVNHTSFRDVTGYVVIHPEHLREPMAQINNRFLTLFGCSISDWQPNETAAS
jgi:integrase